MGPPVEIIIYLSIYYTKLSVMIKCRRPLKITFLYMHHRRGLCVFQELASQQFKCYKEKYTRRILSDRLCVLSRFNLLGLLIQWLLAEGRRMEKVYPTKTLYISDPACVLCGFVACVNIPGKSNQVSIQNVRKSSRRGLMHGSGARTWFSLLSI